jgi:cell division inhibitor SepF
VNAIFSKLRDFVGLNDSVDYEYEYDAVANDDYRDLYQEEQPPQPPQAAPEPAESGRRRSRLNSLGTQSSSGLTVGMSSGAAEAGVRSTGSSTMSNVIGMPGIANGVSEVVVMEPRSFEEMPQAIAALRERKSVVLNLTMMDPDQAQRSVDFIAGGTYALDGHQERIGESIFLFTPNCVQVSTQSGLVHEVLQAQSRATRATPPTWSAEQRYPHVAAQ